jgi:hypothetical protein
MPACGKASPRHFEPGLPQRGHLPSLVLSPDLKRKSSAGFGDNTPPRDSPLIHARAAAGLIASSKMGFFFGGFGASPPPPY